MQTSKKSSRPAAVEAPVSVPEPIRELPAAKKASKKKASKKTPSKKTPSKKTPSKKTSVAETASPPDAETPIEAEPIETPISPVELRTEEQKAERARIKAERVAARRAETEARIAEQKARTEAEKQREADAEESEPEESEPEIDAPDLDVDVEFESEPEFEAEPEPEPEAEREPEPLAADDIALIEEISETLRVFEDARDRARDLRRALRSLENPAAAAMVLELFDRDGDPFQLRTHLLVALERMPEDDYFAALLEAMPRMVDEAPEWAFSALMRLLNSRSHPDDSAFRFEAAARAAAPDVREAIAELLLEYVEELPDEQANMVVQTISGLTRR